MKLTMIENIEIQNLLLENCLVKLKYFILTIKKYKQFNNDKRIPRCSLVLEILSFFPAHCKYKHFPKNVKSLGNSATRACMWLTN